MSTIFACFGLMKVHSQIQEGDSQVGTCSPTRLTMFKQEWNTLDWDDTVPTLLTYEVHVVVDGIRGHQYIGSLCCSCKADQASRL